MIELSISNNGVPVTLAIAQSGEQGVVLELRIPSLQGQLSADQHSHARTHRDFPFDHKPCAGDSSHQQMLGARWCQWRQHFRHLLAQS